MDYTRDTALRLHTRTRKHCYSLRPRAGSGDPRRPSGNLHTHGNSLHPGALRVPFERAGQGVAAAARAARLIGVDAPPGGRGLALVLWSECFRAPASERDGEWILLF